MAKTKGPLLSLDAHGSLSKLLTYSNKRTGQQVRKYNKPLLPPSAKQRGQRRLTEFLVAQWQNMSAGAKATWAANAKAASVNLPGYHYFLREAQRDPYTHAGLCLYLHCNEIVNGKVLDLSGRANHGTLSPTYPSDSPTLVASQSTRLGNGLLYNGSSHYVNCGAVSELSGVNTITIEVLLKPGRTNVNDIYFSRGFYKEDGFYLWNESGFWKIAINKSDTFTFISPFITLSLNTYVWLTITINNITLDTLWYVNGQYAKTKVIPWAFEINPSRETNLGRHSADSNYYKGGLDEISVYNRIFSTAEIATRYKFATAKVPNR